MNTDQEKLKSLLKRLSTPGGAPLSAEEKEWIEDFHRRYPFFTIPGALAGVSGSGPSLEEVATVPSGEALARLHDHPEASRFDNFYPPKQMPATPSTNDAIDEFLNTYGHRSDEEDALLERLIFNPVADYAQQLAREEEASLPSLASTSADTPEGRLNRFILSHRSAGSPLPQKTTPSATPPAAETAAENATATISPDTTPVARTQHQPADTPAAAPPDGLLSESLAKIYIKTRRYERAYEILNGLSLRFPEKSAYFADQLRFLQKLIINEQRRRIENHNNINPNP